MSTDGSPTPARLPSPRHPLSLDLVVVVMLSLCGSVLVFAPPEAARPLSDALSVLFTLFLPGYVLSVVLFPATTDGPQTSRGQEETESRTRRTAPSEDDGPPEDALPTLAPVRRIALSILGSASLYAAVGFVVEGVPVVGDERALLTLAVVSALTLVGALIAVRQRRALSSDERFYVPYDAWASRIASTTLEPDSRADLALTIAAVIMLVLVAGSVGYALTTPKTSGTFTEFYLLTQNETGALIADDYPTEFVAGEPRPVIVGIGNQEYEEISYTVVVELQDVRTENNDTVVLERERLHEFSPTVAHNETWQQRHRIEPTLTGQRLRLSYMLYRNQPPSTPTTQNAYRTLRLWVNVSAPQATTNSVAPAPAASSLTQARAN